jgi:hypothetical protein
MGRGLCPMAGGRHAPDAALLLAGSGGKQTLPESGLEDPGEVGVGMTDFMSALRAYLLGIGAVTDLCGTSIYVLSLPKEEIGLGAHKCVVLLSSGGEIKLRRTTLEARVDVVCYGETDFEAAVMERPVAEALKQLNRAVCANVLLHNATVATGPFQAKDPETFWPAMRRQIVLRADEREVG